MKVLIVSPWVPQYSPSQHTDRPSQVTVVRPWQNTAGMRVNVILYEGIPDDRRDELLTVLRTRLRPGGRMLAMDGSPG